MREEQRADCIAKLIKNLPTLRTMLHFSQSDLADRIGVTRQQIVSLETQKRRMTWMTFLAILFVFSENQETRLLLETFGIYTSDLRDFIQSR